MLGEKIKRLRIDNGLTQKEMAEKLFVTPQAVSRWENNEVEPSVKTLNELAKMFNVSVDSIINEDSKEPIEESAPLPIREPETVQTKLALTICHQCNKPIYEGEELNRISIPNHSDKILCKSCNNANKKAKYEKAKSYGIKQRTRSFVWGGIFSALITAVLLFIVLSAKHDTGSVVLAVMIGVFSFPFISCLYLKNNFIGDLVAAVASWGFVRLPGLIFTLDLDGIIWLLTVKLLFWILGLILSTLSFMLAIVLGYVMSVFVYPFAIVKSFRKPEQSSEI